MKAVTYHYVREGSPELPYFRYLHIDDFCRQLDHFQSEYESISQREFLTLLQEKSSPPPNSIVLTFDDGFADHYHYVFPELMKRGMWAVFFVTTGIYQTGQALDVHRIHYLLGRYGGPFVMDALNRIITREMLSDENFEEIQRATYRQDNDEATTMVKRILNYYISYEWRHFVIDELMKKLYDEARLFQDLYATPDQIREMSHAGMLIGSHTISHALLSRLSVAEQRREILDSFAYVQNNLTSGGPRLFCYPYGWPHSFTPETMNILDETGCLASFTVEFRDISHEDLRLHPQALPRYDCNLFPYGRARLG